MAGRDEIRYPRDTELAALTTRYLQPPRRHLNSGADFLGLPAPEPGEFLDELSDDARTI
jgi:hypothetical protein